MPDDQWNANNYERSYSYVWEYGSDLVQLLNPQPGERILDLGCGTGPLTAKIAASGASVIGIDASPSMIARAREQFPELDFRVADARDFTFPEPFDAIFSNAVLHWVREAEAAIACVSRALTPGGRFVAEFGGRGNIREVIPAIERGMAEYGYPPTPEMNPWYYPGIPEYGSLLEKHGLELVQAALFERPTRLEGEESGMSSWLEMFAGSFLNTIPSEDRPRVARAIEDAARPALFRDGSWYADYRRFRLVAIRGHR